MIKKFIRTNSFKNQVFLKYFCENNHKLYSIEELDPSSIKFPTQLMLIKEFLEGIENLYNFEFHLAEEKFEKLKNNLRPWHISSYTYCLVIRRLGIAKLQQNKLNEGILELENFFEFSLSKDFDSNFQFRSLADMLKTYIINDDEKGFYFAFKLIAKKQYKDLISEFSSREQAYIYYLINIALFIKKKIPFFHLKNSLQEIITLTDLLYEKLEYLYILTIIQYHEIKFHNHIFEENLKEKKNKDNSEEDNTIDKNMFGEIIPYEDRIVRRISKEDMEFIKNKKKEIFEEQILADKNRDMFYKKLIKMSLNSIEDYKKDFIDASRKIEMDIKIKKKNHKDQYNLLEKSILDKNLKINPILHNIENFENEELEISKLIGTEIDFKNNFNSIIGNLFIIIKNKENSNITNINDFNFVKYFEKNLHKNSDILDFIREIPQLKDKFNKIFPEKMKQTKNEFKEIINFDYIDEFKDIMELDNYFTLVRNEDSYKICLFFAEIFTENSKQFKDESSFWIKYSLTLGKLYQNPDFQCRAVILACAHILDHRFDLELVNKILDILNDTEELIKNPINKAMIAHLYGVIAYTDQRLKGEALELIEKSKNLKNKYHAKENLFYINITPLDFDSDLDENLLDLSKKIFI